MRHLSGASISDTVKCSQQAFSKARSGIDHSIFKECFERVLDFLCSRDSLDFHSRFMGVWGRQIIAVDGSKIPLPNRKTLLDKYGSIGRRYIDDQTLRNIGKDLDLKYEQVRQMESKALRELRQSGRSRKYRRYFEEYISAESYHHVGVESFQRTWMSEVEREVLGWIC